MSQSPSDDAPSGVPPPNPVPPSGGRRRIGCWGVGCITLASLVLIFAVLIGLTFTVKPEFWRQIAGTAQELGRCAPNLHAVHSALERHRKAEGEYPAKLLDLNPRFISRRELFHCPADTAPETAVSYEYQRPAADAPPQTVVLSCRHHRLTVSGRKAVYRVNILKNGELRQETQLLPP